MFRESLVAPYIDAVVLLLCAIFFLPTPHIYLRISILLSHNMLVKNLYLFSSKSILSEYPYIRQYSKDNNSKYSDLDKHPITHLLKSAIVFVFNYKK